MYIDITPAVWFYCHRVVINRIAAAVAARVAPLAIVAALLSRVRCCLIRASCNTHSINGFGGGVVAPLAGGLFADQEESD